MFSGQTSQLSTPSELLSTTQINHLSAGSKLSKKLKILREESEGRTKVRTRIHNCMDTGMRKSKQARPHPENSPPLSAPKLGFWTHDGAPQTSRSSRFPFPRECRSYSAAQPVQTSSQCGSSFRCVFCTLLCSSCATCLL